MRGVVVRPLVYLRNKGRNEKIMLRKAEKGRSKMDVCMDPPNEINTRDLGLTSSVPLPTWYGGVSVTDELHH